jgi:hypothetical protein
MGFRKFPLRKQRFLRKGIAFVTHFFIFFRNGCQPHMNIRVSPLLSTDWAAYIFLLKNFGFLRHFLCGINQRRRSSRSHRRRNH